MIVDRSMFPHLLLVTAVLLATGRAAGASDPLARVEDDLRKGHYERALKSAEALGRRAPKATAARAAVLGARAEARLGRLREARRRLEEATVRSPDDLPLRA